MMITLNLKSCLLASSALGAIVISIFASGCGIATGPVSLPDAVAQNADFSFHGSIVEATGQPLDNVILAQTLNHHFWTPIEGGKDTDERKLRNVSRTFAINERGSILKCTFTRDGFYDTEFSFDFADPNIVTTPNGSWPNTPNFPVVLYSKSQKDAELATWRGDINYSDYPTAKCIHLTWLAERTAYPVMPDSRPANLLSPGVFHLTLTKGTPVPINSHGDLSPVDINLPENITLHIAGEDGGFVRIEPRLGYAPMQICDKAPTTGYQKELTFDRKRLRAMRTAAPNSVLSAHEYFYFRANGHYGKGWIAWSQVFNSDQKDPLPTSFRFAFYESRSSEDTNLTSLTLTSN